MTTADVSSRPDPTRSGAVWVTGMGVFLLLAAAAVFTAVRWGDIPDAAKLAALVAATGACLLAGRTLRPTIPASAGALFHLGLFLIPVDVAAMAVRADLDWPALLLIQGLAGSIAFGWGAVLERSVVLRWAFAGAVVALAGGIGAVTPVPAPLVLSLIALAALGAGHLRPAIGWAGVAGSAPLLALLDVTSGQGQGVMDVLGLAGDQSTPTATVTGVVAAAVLGLAGRRRGDVGLALVGVMLAGLGIATTWSGLDAGPGATLILLAGAFLAAELSALAMREDPFWQAVTKAVADLAEIPARLAVGAGIAALVVAPLSGWTDGPAALASAVAAAGWVVVELRSERGSVSATLGAPVTIVAAVALGTGSPVAVAAALAGVALLAVWSPRLDGSEGMARPGADLVVLLAAVGAPLMALSASHLAATATGLLGAVVLTEAAVRRTRPTVDSDPRKLAEAEGWAWVLGTLAMAPGAIGVAAWSETSGSRAVVLIVAAALATALAARADQSRTVGALPLGTIARLGSLSLLAGTGGMPPAQIGLVAAVVAGLALADAARQQEPMVALGASVAGPVAIGTLCYAAGLSVPTTGVALTLAAAVIAGVGSQASPRWLPPVGAAVLTSVLAGLALAAGDAAALADALIVTGGIGLAGAVSVGRLDGVYVAGAIVTSGIWIRLADGGVGASEPYLLPVGALLLVAGVRARSIGTSSWVAYGPIVGLLGGSALVERIAGGPGWHALVAGGVGLAAVLVGAQRRLAGPLLLGSALLVALVGFETLAVTRGLPTWIWLALGGTTLLASGVAMERRDLGPIETGRRLVDVVSDRYA